MRILKQMSRVLIWAMISTLFFASCSDSDEQPPIEEADCTVAMKVSLSSEGNDEVINPIQVSLFLNKDSAVLETVPANQEWTKEVNYASVPGIVGFVVSPSFKESVKIGDQFDCKIKYELMLLYKGEIVEYKKEEEDISLTLDKVPSEDTDFSEAFVFNVSKDGFERISEDDLFQEQKTEPVEELPEKDKDLVKSDGRLYFLKSISDAEAENTLRDNLIARFVQHGQWSGTQLQFGDYLYLRGGEFNSVDKNKLKESLSSGLIIILDELSSGKQLDAICEEMEIYNPLGENVQDVTHSLFIVGNADSFFTNEDGGVGYDGLFFQVAPFASDGEKVSDYSQGEMLDRVIAILNEMDEPSAERLKSDSNDLKTLVAANKVYLSGGNCKQTLNRSDYRGDYASASQSNVYNLELDIWSVYSVSEKRSYYYIHQEFTGAFGNCYKGLHARAVTTNGCYTIAKVSEWYGDYVNVKTYTDTNGADMRLHRNSPETTKTDKTYTSGFQWDLSGEVQLGRGGVQSGTIHSGISLNFSTSYTKTDLTVTNKSVPGYSMEWSFDLTKASASFNPFYVAGSDMSEGSLTGRSTLNTGMDYVISFPYNKSKAPSLSVELKVRLRSSCAKCGSICGERFKEANYQEPIYLPIVKIDE